MKAYKICSTITFCMIVCYCSEMLYADLQNENGLLNEIQKIKFETNGDFGLKDTDNVFKQIVSYSKNPDFNQEVEWASITKLLDFSSKIVNQLANDPRYSYRPDKNVYVDGLPVSGMAIEDVKDPIIKERYQAAIHANNILIAETRYRLNWYKLYREISYFSRQYIKKYGQNTNNLNEELSIINNYDRIASAANP